jgi:hypothetical protein
MGPVLVGKVSSGAAVEGRFASLLGHSSGSEFPRGALSE